MAKNKEEKTNVMRTLDQKKIPYTAFSYDPNGPIDGVSVAAETGLDAASVFKTLVTKGASGAYYVFDIPVAENLDLKKGAKAVGEKSIAMLPQKELLPLTGYVHGGCSPVGMKKQFPTVFHETVNDLELVAVSAGKIGFHSDVVGGIAVYDAFPPGDGHIYQCTVSAVHEQTVSRLYLGSIFKIDSHPGKRGLRIDRIDLHNVKPEDKRSGEAHYLRNYIIFSFSGSKPDVFLTLLHYPRPHRSSSDQSVSSFFSAAPVL